MLRFGRWYNEAGQPIGWQLSGPWWAIRGIKALFWVAVLGLVWWLLSVCSAAPAPDMHPRIEA